MTKADRPKRGVRESGQILGAEMFNASSRATSYRFRLYISGKNKKSRLALETLDKLSTLFPAGRFSAEVIDVHERADLAQKDDVLAVPALIKLHPPPPTTFIGATNDHLTVLRRLGIPLDPAQLSRFKTAGA